MQNANNRLNYICEHDGSNALSKWKTPSTYLQPHYYLPSTPVSTPPCVTFVKLKQRHHFTKYILFYSSYLCTANTKTNPFSLLLNQPHITYFILSMHCYNLNFFKLFTNKMLNYYNKTITLSENRHRLYVYHFIIDI